MKWIFSPPQCIYQSLKNIFKNIDNMATFLIYYFFSVHIVMIK